jgi:predicted GIY-YIG superfamily endonuclease
MKRTFLYAIGTEDGPIKIGITGNLWSRLQTLQNGSPHKLELIFVFTLYDKATALTFEKWFCDAFEADRLKGEWFNITADEAFERLDGIVDLAYSAFNFRTRREQLEATR